MRSVLTGLLLAASAAAAPAAERPFAFGGVRFEENRGQTAPEVRFVARARGQQVFFTDRGIVLSPYHGAPVRMSFAGGAPAEWAGLDPAPDTISYFVGKDPSRWIRGAPLFGRVLWPGVYPGIDAVFYGRGGHIEYDLIVAPGADPSSIRVRFEGGPVRTTDGGALEIRSGNAVVRQRAPHIYQNLPGGRRDIPGRFQAVGGGVFRLMVGAFDRALPLVVDPVLEAATYLGGENDDEIVALTEGAVAGHTRSLSFPGAYAAPRPTRDLFLRGAGPVIPGQFGRNDFTGTLIFGGSGDDELAGIATASTSGFVYLAGTTTSTDLPFQNSKYRGGVSDGFVATIQTAQNYPYVGGCQYIGGSGEDRINAFQSADNIFALAGVTDSPDLVAAEGAQRHLAGGKDAFYGISYLYAEAFALGYLGGSADDAAYSVGVKRQSPSGTGVWIGGETRSEDFPSISPGLSGESDAFLADVSVTLTPAPAIVRGITAYRFGGGGRDSIRAIVSAPAAPITAPGDSYPYFRPDLTQQIGIAGVTSSADLPLLNPFQDALAGGTDAFVGMWNVPGAGFSWLTYLGGSGDDEVTSMVQNWAGDLYAGGWTSSGDVPVRAPLQARSAGGEDGLLAVFGPSGAPYHITYYGGSGDDRIRGVRLIYGNVLRVAGGTGSSDLPEKNAWASRGGRREGFVADIGTDHLIGPAELVLSKDGSFTFSLRAGRTAYRVPVTYRTSDPSRLRFSYYGRTRDQVTAAADDNITVEAFAGEGEADITAEAEGFLTKTIRVRLYPGALVPVMPAATLSTWTPPLTPVAYYRAIHPETGQPLGPAFGLRTGITAPTPRWSVSDPSVLAIATGQPGGLTQITILGPGQATLTFAAEGYDVYDAERTVTVIRPKIQPAAGFRLGRDIQANLPISFTYDGIFINSGMRGQLTARTTDPSRLLLSVSPSQVGRETVTVTIGDRSAVVYAQALAGEGEVQVVFTSPELDGETAMTVTLEPAALRWGRTVYIGGQSRFEPSFELTVDSTSPPSPIIAVGGESSVGSSSRRPGAPPLILTLASSDPRVVGLNRLTVQYGASEESFKLFGIRPGTADLTLSVSDPHVRILNPTAAVVVKQNQTYLSGLPKTAAAGKGLQALLALRYLGSQREVTVISDDPSALLVSDSQTRLGSGEVTLVPSRSYSDEYVFYIQALKSEGEVRVRVRTADFEEAEVRVTLFPPAVGFSSYGRSAGASSFQHRAYVTTYAADAATGIAVARMAPLPDQQFEVRLRTEGSPIRISTETVTLNLEKNEAAVDYTLPEAGAQAWIIAEATGLVASGAGRLLLENTRQPALKLNSSRIQLTRDGLAQISFSAPAGAEVTVTSADPGRLLVSAGSTDTGAASIRLNGQKSVFLHALGESGNVAVRFELAGEPAQEAAVALQPLVLSMGTAEVAVGETREITVQLGVYSGLRPGAGPLRINLRTSDPGVAVLDPSTIELSGPALKTSATVRVTGIAPGAARVIPEIPSDIYQSQTGWTVRVGTSQAAAIPAYRLGKHLQGADQISLPAAVANPSGMILSLTSSDPGRLLLSRAATTAGSAAVSLAVPAGEQRTQLVYIQALDGEGDVELRAEINGVTWTLAVVRLTPSWVACAPQPGVPFSVPVGSTMQVACYLATSTASSAPQFRSLTVRPGVQDQSFRLISSAPGLFVVTPGVLTLGALDQRLAVRGIAPGEGELRIEQPAGFGPAPDGADAVTINVVLPILPVGCGPEMTIGKDLQTTCGINLPPGVELRAVSLDPPLLLVSNDPAKAGAASVTVMAAGQTTNLAFQALVHFGTVEVLFTAPGYQPRRVAVRLVPALVSHSYAGWGDTITIRKGQKASFGLELGGSRTPRPGSAIGVELSLNPAGIAEAQPARVVFENSVATVEILGIATGSAVLRLKGADGLTVPDAPLLVSVID